MVKRKPSTNTNAITVHPMFSLMLLLDSDQSEDLMIK